MALTSRFRSPRDEKASLHSQIDEQFGNLARIEGPRQVLDGFLPAFGHLVCANGLSIGTDHGDLSSSFSVPGFMVYLISRASTPLSSGHSPGSNKPATGVDEATILIAATTGGTRGP